MSGELVHRGLGRVVRRVRGVGAGDSAAGFSLVELLVTMVLLGILGTVVGTTFASSTDSLQRSTWRQENTRLAQTGMETLTKSVRAGSLVEQSGGGTAVPAFREATATSLEVHSFVGDRPMRLRYSIDAQGRLIETRRKATAGSSSPYWTFSSTATTRIVIDRVVNSAGEPLFVYRDGTGAAFPSGALNEASRRGIRSVDITLHVQTDDPGRVRPAEVEQRVHLPNLGSIG
ncbi:PilW family protein [Aquipuribacter sp. MA13-6]|uniref:PilW family protein n=1 Tax=unclassified Aquipuribacter TaxID=2635084 RepID=UPI003EED6FC2